MAGSGDGRSALVFLAEREYNPAGRILTAEGDNSARQNALYCHKNPWKK
jgi:hypothetical protein